MKVLVFLPIDAIVKTWARRFEADGHEVVSTFTFSVFLRQVRRADWTLINLTKHDHSRYLLKLWLGLLVARLLRRRTALFISIDPVDLCDRPVLRGILRAVNRVAFHCATLVFLLATREHVARRYRLAERRLHQVFNCPDRTAFAPAPARQVADLPHPVTFLYHGELLWWHGLERFLPVYEEVKKRRPARLIITGNFYSSAFRVFGLAASRREVALKRRLADVLKRDDVEYRGRVSIEELRRLMAEADFHVSLLNDEDAQARTELRTCLLEAMAAAMACLHAPTPALFPDIFRDEENIILVDPNDPSAAAEKILGLIASPEHLEEIRRNAVRTIADHFDMEKQYAQAAAILTAHSR
jgi:glycosyltransferase involved in cell wall biosynthesis